MSGDANALCAFTVVVDGSGTPRVLGPGPIDGLVTYRDATDLDIRRAVLELAADYQARTAAEWVVGLLTAEPAPVSDRVSAALAKYRKGD